MQLYVDKKIPIPKCLACVIYHIIGSDFIFWPEWLLEKIYTNFGRERILTWTHCLLQERTKTMSSNRWDLRTILRIIVIRIGVKTFISRGWSHTKRTCSLKRSVGLDPVLICTYFSLLVCSNFHHASDICFDFITFLLNIISYLSVLLIGLRGCALLYAIYINFHLDGNFCICGVSLSYTLAARLRKHFHV